MHVKVIQNVQHRQGGGPGDGPVFETDCEEGEGVTSNVSTEAVEELKNDLSELGNASVEPEAEASTEEPVVPAIEEAKEEDSKPAKGKGKK